MGSGVAEPKGNLCDAAKKELTRFYMALEDLISTRKLRDTAPSVELAKQPKSTPVNLSANHQ